MENKDDKKTYVAKFTLKDIHTGSCKEFVERYAWKPKDDLIDDAWSVHFLLVEHNMGCDCARGDLFYNSEEDFKCDAGDKRFLMMELKIYDDDKMILSFDGPEKLNY